MKASCYICDFLFSTVPPRITAEPERESEVSVGQNLTLTCNASGDPFPEVTWSKDGQLLRLFNVTGPVLHLVNVTREDVGSYKCTAQNKVGEDSRRVLVNVACKLILVVIILLALQLKKSVPCIHTIDSFKVLSKGAVALLFSCKLLS